MMVVARARSGSFGHDGRGSATGSDVCVTSDQAAIRPRIC